VDYLRLKRFVKRLLGQENTPPPPEPPKPASEVYSPALIEKYAWKPGRGRFPGLSGNAHQRRITRRKKG
jgi:hypothetical protein